MGFGSVGLVFIENNLCQFIDIIAVVRYIWNCLIVIFVSLFFFDRKPASNAAGTMAGRLCYRQWQMMARAVGIVAG